MDGDDFRLFDPGEPFDLPDGLPDLPQDIYSPFGFRLGSRPAEEGEEISAWMPATTEDFHDLLLRHPDVFPDAVNMMEDAQFGSLCYLWNGMCPGRCPTILHCYPVYDRTDGTTIVACICR